MEDFLRQGDGGADARGVFVDVEGVVEMGDAQAFDVQLRVERETGAEVGGQQVVVGGAEGVEGETPRRLLPWRA